MDPLFIPQIDITTQRAYYALEILTKNSPLFS